MSVGVWKRKDSFHLRWPLSFMWEIHWRWFGRPGGWPARKPQGASCTNRFLRGLQTDVARAGLLCGCNLTTLKQNIWENFVPLFFQALNSVGQQQHSTIWGWDADPAVLFRWWLRIAVPLFCWLRITAGKDEPLLHAFATHIRVTDVDYVQVR